MRFQFLIFCSLMLFSACGGGGGGSATTTSSATTPTAFSSWLNITYPSVVTADAIAYEGTYSYQTTSPYAITSVDAAAQASSPSVKLTYNSSGALTEVRLITSSQTQIYDTFTTANASGTLYFGEKSGDSNDWALAADPVDDDLQWRYHAIAVWTEPDSGSGKYGSIAGGAETSGSSIPTSGSYSFSGQGVGFHADASNDVYFAQSDLTAAANFASRSVSVTTSNTFKQQYNATNGSFGSAVTDSNLDLTGTLTYSSATNDLSGNLTSTSGLTGTAIGRFYGPDANEFGAVFNLTGSGETFIGSLGGK